MSKTPCTNTAPIAEDLANKASGRGREGVCSECGAFLVILDSGVFRQHGRRLKAGSPKIAEAVETRKANLAPAPAERDLDYVGDEDEDLAPWPTAPLEAPAAPVEAPAAPVETAKHISEIQVGDRVRSYTMNLEVVARRVFPGWGTNAALDAMGLRHDVYSLRCRVLNADDVKDSYTLKGLLEREGDAYFWTLQGNMHPQNVYSVTE